MSAAHELETGRSGQSRSRQAERRLEPVPDAVPPLRQLPFGILLVGVLGIGMLGLLLLNTSLQDQSFRLSELQAKATRLAYTEDALQHQLDQVSSPSSLVAKATELGMRPYVAPGFIVLPDGTVIGNPKKATGKDFTSSLIKSPAQLEAERRAAEAKKQAAEEKRQAAEDQRKADEKKAEEDKKKADEKKSDEKKSDEKKSDEKKSDEEGE